LIKEIIQTVHAPKAIGTYSQGVKIQSFLFTSGQIPINQENGKLIKNDFKLEVHQVLRNLNAILKEGGSSLNLVVKLTVFLIDISYLSQINEVFNDYFSKDPPARSTVQVTALPMDARVEIEAIGLIQ
jgi:2-iminobutanoate/2-iminopropanoate deaminase